MNEDVKKQLVDSLEDCISTFNSTGALPSPIMELPYSMLLAIYRAEPVKNPKEQELVSFMVSNYFVNKYGCF